MTGKTASANGLRIDGMGPLSTQGLDAGLFHVHVSAREAVSREDLIAAIKAPSSIRAPAVAHALRAFMEESHESVLATAAREGEITWRDLAAAARAVLRDGDPKKEWILERDRFEPMLPV